MPLTRDPARREHLLVTPGRNITAANVSHRASGLAFLVKLADISPFTLMT